jgi:GDPmannose 4,6-dehydratase
VAHAQEQKADDFVIATNEQHSVKELLEIAFSFVGLDWHRYVRSDPRLVRPAEVDWPVGDSTKARTILKWQPMMSFQSLFEMMVEADLKSLR